MLRICNYLYMMWKNLVVGAISCQAQKDLFLPYSVYSGRLPPENKLVAHPWYHTKPILGSWGRVALCAGRHLDRRDRIRTCDRAPLESDAVLPDWTTLRWLKELTAWKAKDFHLQARLVTHSKVVSNHWVIPLHQTINNATSSYGCDSSAPRLPWCECAQILAL